MDVALNRIGQGWTLCGGEIDNYCRETYLIDKHVLRGILSIYKFSILIQAINNLLTSLKQLYP